MNNKIAEAIFNRMKYNLVIVSGEELMEALKEERKCAVRDFVDYCEENLSCSIAEFHASQCINDFAMTFEEDKTKK